MRAVLEIELASFSCEALAIFDILRYENIPLALLTFGLGICLIHRMELLEDLSLMQQRGRVGIVRQIKQWFGCARSTKPD